MDRVASSSLLGKRVVVTRAARQSRELIDKLSKLDALPISLPLVAFSAPEDFGPLDAALDHLEKFDWIIFTSENAVRAVVKRASARGNLRNVAGIRSRAAAVGATTAGAAERAGFFIEYQAKTHTGAALANELGERLRDQTVFLPRSDRANPDLPALLREHGAQVTEAIAYCTVSPVNLDRQKISEIVNGGADAILFFSPTAVDHFVNVVGDKTMKNLQNRVSMAAVGPVTANALQKAGVENGIVADDASADAVVSALEKHFSGQMNASPAGVHKE